MSRWHYQYWQRKKSPGTYSIGLKRNGTFVDYSCSKFSVFETCVLETIKSRKLLEAPIVLCYRSSLTRITDNLFHLHCFFSVFSEYFQHDQPGLRTAAFCRLTKEIGVLS